MSGRSLRAPLIAVCACILLGVGVSCSGSAPTAPPSVTTADPLGKVAYVLDGDIYVKRLPDGTPQRITTHTYGNTSYLSPTWSPSGDWLLAYTNAQATVMRADGSDARVYEGRFTQPVWSPVADRLAYIHSSGAGGAVNDELVVQDADGSDRRAVATAHPAANENALLSDATWSVDGTRIAYAEHRQIITAGQAVQHTYEAILQVPADGSAPPDELYGPGSPPAYGIGLIGWSTDDSNLVFFSRPAFTADIADGAQLLRIPARVAAKAQALTDAPMLTKPELWAFGPDATLVTTGGSGRETWTHKQLEVIDTGTGGWRVLTDPAQAVIEPAWSPDLTRIAYSGAPDAPDVPGGDEAKAAMAKRKIWVMDADGSNQRQLTDDPAYRDERPQWMADGSRILFVRLDANDRASLWLVPADGGTPSPVVDDLGPLPDSFGPVWFGFYGYIAWDSLFAVWSPPPSARAAATNPLAMASLGLTLQYQATWVEGAAVEPYASCVGCTILGPQSALHPYGVEIFTEDLDPGCAVSCYVGNNAIGPGNNPLGPASQESVRVADIDSKRMEIRRQVPLGIVNATGDDTPYREIWTLVPWYGKALFFVAFFREGDSAAESETRAVYDAMLASVTRLSPPPARGQYSSFALQTVSVGQTILVWGYADASPTRDNCISALPDMMPASADVPGGKLITCTVDPVAASRLRFLEGGAGVLHLSSVEILLPATAAPPNGLERNCNDLRSILLPASADPSTAYVRFVCLVEPPARGTVSASRAEFLAYVLPNTGPTAASTPVDCWELARFIGAPADAGAVTVPCLLD